MHFKSFSWIPAKGRTDVGGSCKLVKVAQHMAETPTVSAGEIA